MRMNKGKINSKYTSITSTLSLSITYMLATVDTIQFDHFYILGYTRQVLMIYCLIKGFFPKVL